MGMGRGYRRKLGYRTAKDILGRAPRSRWEKRRVIQRSVKRGNEAFVRRHGAHLAEIVAARPALAADPRRNSRALTVRASLAYLRCYHPALARRNGWAR